MLERQIMFKQLQVLQRQKKLQELNDARQQNVMQNKHSSVTHYGLLNNGVPVRDASQMFMFGDTNMVHRLPNTLVYSQAQNQVLQSSMGHLSHFQGPVFSHIGSQTRKTHQVNNHKDFNGIEESGITLDPLEQKILFNMEFEKKDNSSDYGCLQSGSMSALMQTAVAEASNGDSGLSFQNPELSNENQTSNMMEVKNEDGEKKSTFEVKPGTGQQVASSRRQPNTWVDVHVHVPLQQNPPSTSYAVNRKMETGLFGQGSSKMRQHGNRGHAVKKERVDYDNTVPQLPSFSHLNSACGSYKSQPIASSATDRSVKASIDQCGTKTNDVALTQSSSIYLQQLNMAKENMVVLNSKKRKLSKFQQLPCHKEVSEGCTRLHDTINAEVEWAHSVNRLPEKVTDLISIVDRKRRRLILTTQLMQMLFRPAPTIFFSENATKYCDIVTCYVAKLTMGDACSIMASGTSKSSGDKDLSKIVEGFIDRSKRMEDVLLRLEKEESTILDIKVEFQDLDKFQIINRFAKFHSRGTLVTNDTSSSGGASTMQKLDPQRYVTASEMPPIVPEGRYCLSL